MSLWRALHRELSRKGIFISCPFFVNHKKTHEMKNTTADIFVWRLDCRLKYVYYLLLTKFVIFDYFWGRIRLFLGSLWRALHWNATTPPFFTPPFCFVSSTKQKRWVKNMIERFVWRLDCRLKYIYYLQQTRVNLMIFRDFGVKNAYFWRSLWRALHWNATTPPDFYAVCLFFISKKTTDSVKIREACVTVWMVWRISTTNSKIFKT